MILSTDMSRRYESSSEIIDEDKNEIAICHFKATINSKSDNESYISMDIVNMDRFIEFKEEALKDFDTFINNVITDSE